MSKIVEHMADIDKAFAVAADNAFHSVMITTVVPGTAGPPITYVNPAFSELTGYTADEVIGKTPGILQGPKTDPSVLKRLRETLARGEEFHGRAINYRKDGSEFMMEWKITPVRNAQGEVIHYVAVQRDADLSEAA
jgi:PAS domain S-box-containing protein